MTPSEIALVRDGFERVAPKAREVGMTFYQRLFALDPTLRPLFPDDLRAQATHLMTTLAMVVHSLDDLEPLLDRVRDLGRRHAGYGVHPCHFGTVGAALLGTLEAGLGERFTPEARAAWATAYGILADVMIAAMPRTASNEAARPNGTR